ncbi:MAG: thioesterase family protein [Armatimonadota bacterium]|nr:thioesterase family protein [Armatimonadota bacterium]
MRVTLPLEVRYAETDQMGVAHHAAYVVWMEAARVEFLKRVGSPYHELERSGVRLPVVELRVTYRAPASFGQVVQVSCEVQDVRSRAATFRYAVEAEGRRLAEGYTRHVCCDGQGRAIPLPEALRRLLEGASSADRSGPPGHQGELLYNRPSRPRTTGRGRW